MPPYRPTIDVDAASYVTRYDKDSDGAITVRGYGDETSTTQYHSYGNPYHDPPPLIPGYYSTTSIERMARVADLMGDADGKATAWEIADLMRLYDRGGDEGPHQQDWIRPDFDLAIAHDSTLNGGERTDFLEDFGQEEVPEPGLGWGWIGPDHGPVDEAIDRYSGPDVYAEPPAQRLNRAQPR